MKRLITILIIPLFVFLLLSTVSAHSGRTDSRGGHYNRATGEYHYHHGYPEHQHINGKCPYAYNNNSNFDNSDNVTSSEQNKRTSVPVIALVAGGIFTSIWVIPLIMEFIIYPISDIVKNKRKKAIHKQYQIWLNKNMDISTLLCTDCEFCKYKKYKIHSCVPGLAFYIPKKCKLLKIKISSDTKCQIEKHIK